MTFTDYLTEQWKLHPSIQPQDIIKLCYQAAFGAEHLLLDTDRAKAYFIQEWENTPADSSQPLYETISEYVCRINLASWKAKGRSPEALFAKFALSAAVATGSKELFEEYLSDAESFVLNNYIFPLKDWADFLTEYKKIGSPAVHHSESYRQSEHPAYRIIRKEYLEELLNSNL